MIAVLLSAALPSFVRAEWPCPRYARLVYRTDGGTAYLDEGRVVALTAFGRPERTVRCAPDRVPLFYGKDSGLVSAPAPLLSAQDVRPGDLPSPKIFAERDHVFVGSLDATYLGRGSAHTLPRYGPYSAVAASGDGRILALLYPGEDAPRMRLAKRSDRDWTDLPETIVPTIAGIGVCSVLPRFNDALFVADDAVAYIGTLSGVADRSRYDAWLPSIPDLGDRPLEDPRKRPGTCFLVLTRTSDGATVAAARLKFWNVGEMGGPRTGRMTLSSDGATLYLMTEGHILAMSVLRLLGGFHRGPGL